MVNIKNNGQKCDLASAEPNLFELCRVVTEEDEVKP